MSRADHILLRPGATVDVNTEREWREKGKKLEVETLVIYSESYIGSRYDVPGEWKSWVQESKLKSQALGNDIGHFGAEEGEKSLIDVQIPCRCLLIWSNSTSRDCRGNQGMVEGILINS